MAPKKNTQVATTTEQVPAVETVVPAVVETVVPVPVDEPITVIMQKLNEIQTISKEVILLQKTLQKEYVKLQKFSAKKNAPKAVRSTPSGFAKPAKLSDELCAFLKIAPGSELPRTQVTRDINIYIKEHNLQNPENKKFILPDDTLKTLLRLEPTDLLSYFNLQKYMKHLFI